MINEEISSYFESKNIKILNENFPVKGDLNERDMINQIGNIITFHKYFKSHKVNLSPRISSTIGRELENYKLDCKRLSVEIIRLNNLSTLVDAERYLLENGPLIIEKFEKIIENIKLIGYHELIKRAMENYEVCLNRVDEKNLVMGKEDKLYVGTVKYLTYNLVEHDLYNYIKKVKRKVRVTDLDNLINVYIDGLSLNDTSKGYLKLLAEIPTESFRILGKFIAGKKQYLDDDSLELLRTAISIDEII